ncbi:hypothetical protein R3W88_019448 [Solanum pinnatisectum]|uniref:Aminotransferase-like plant mobile domain-containing protein n=1 Tax=Solanum pinnatisectum TaxID=50273 RepID=A0AAV9KJY3_9SOLN|nr:hypothetical protein R3W88_019448 [Solanum pinnatisectum]
MEDPLMDGRDEMLVSPLGGIPQQRNAHFLNPIVASNEGPNLMPPSIPFSSESEWPLKVSVHEWVEMMEAIHHPVWKAAGIYRAIKSSVYRVQTYQNLIFGCFLFPWGEAIVTLEDMIFLGGFPVLGDSVLSPLQSHELVMIKENLENARRDLIGLKTNNQSRWLNFFMNSGAPIFLMDVNLARGIRLALAPVVLASIYRELGFRNGDKFDIHKLSLWSPLFYVQVWAWERTLVGVRIGRWNKVKQSGVINVRATIDSSGEFFLWRPYALAVEGWSIPKFYKDKEEWTVVGGKILDIEIDPELSWYNYNIPTNSNLKLYYPSRLFESDVTVGF